MTPEEDQFRAAGAGFISLSLPHTGICGRGFPRGAEALAEAASLDLRGLKAAPTRAAEIGAPCLPRYSLAGNLPPSQRHRIC
jgi:hypothetical protein